MKITSKLTYSLAATSLLGFLVKGALTAPSDLMSGEPGPARLTFILRQQEDMRTLYCEKDILLGRQKRNVCRVDSILPAGWRREVAVTTNTTVIDVIGSIGLTNWDGGRQIRLIQKNAIVQSEFPWWPETMAEHNRAFSKIHVQAGDIVIICPYD
jgi:hypothetical protein